MAHCPGVEKDTKAGHTLACADLNAALLLGTGFRLALLIASCSAL